MTVSCRFHVRVTPRSSRTKLEAEDERHLRAWVHSAPTDGQANESVTELLAERLRVPKSSVKLASGATSRNKVFEIDGLDAEEANRRLALHKGSE